MKAKRGFAKLPTEEVRELGRRGGAAVPASLRAFSKDPELAREAGRKGGRGKRRRKPLATV